MANITFSDFNDIKVVKNGETITLTRVNVIKNGSLTTVWEKGSWHTAWTGSIENSLYPDGTYQEVFLTGVSVPSGTQKVRITGVLDYVNIDTMTVEKSNEIYEELTTPYWVWVQQMHEYYADGRAEAQWNGSTSVNFAVCGTAYYPYTLGYRITKVEAYY